MSSRFLNQLPLLALALAAQSSFSAHAATQTTAVPSVVAGPGGAPFVNFTANPLQSSAVASNSPVDLYFKGEFGGAMHCNNPAGCGPVSINLNAAFNFSVPGASGSIDTTLLPMTYVSYGPTAFGDYLDFKPVQLASTPITLSYDQAKSVGLITTDGVPSLPIYGTLSFYSASMYPNPDVVQQLGDFDPPTIALLNPTFNLHYLAAPVPEPSSAAMVVAGLLAVAWMRRRINQAD